MKATILARTLSTRALALSLLCVSGLLSVSDALQAQPYTWRHSLDTLSTECVCFNPLSKGKTLFTASLSDTGIFRSDDGGLSWRNYNDGLQPFSTSRIMQVFCLESDTNVVLAVSTSSGLYRSTNGGRKWSIAVEDGGILGEAITWHRATDALYYGQNFMGPVWKSVDHGATWVQSASPTEGIALCTIAVEPAARKRILAGSGDGGIALSDEEGKNWRIVYDMEDPSEVIRPEVPKIVWSEVVPNVVLATRWLSKKYALIRSLNGGESWSSIENGLPRSWALEIDQRPETATLEGPQRFWIGLFNRGLEPNYVNSVIETRDGGTSWLNTNFPTVEQVWMMKYDTASDRLVVATEKGIFVSTVERSYTLPRASVRAKNSENMPEDLAHLELEDGEIIRSIKLMDVTGRMIAEYTDAVDMSALRSGLYLAVVTTSKRIYRMRSLIVR